MLFADVVARRQFGKENSTTCFVLVAEFFTGESIHMKARSGSGSIRMRSAMPAPGGLNSLNDIFYVISGSPQLRVLVDNGPDRGESDLQRQLRVFACNPRVNYNGNSIQWGQPSSQLSLINAGCAPDW
jgi:hypothetical protein